MFLSLQLLSATNVMALEQKTLDWVLADLHQALQSPVDLNRVSSLTFPLTTVWKSGRKKAVRNRLDEVAAFARSVDTSNFSCGDWADLYLTIGFLAETGREIDFSQANSALNGCDWGEKRFDLANALLFTCRYAKENPEQHLPGALGKLEQAQRRDGAFVTEQGKTWFYLSSHALMAVYYCGGSREVVDRGGGYLLSRLPLFQRQGFYDGLIESLVFLNWLKVDVPNQAYYLEATRAAMNPDGGICFAARRACRSHWHAVSLLLELQMLPGWK